MLRAFLMVLFVAALPVPGAVAQTPLSERENQLMGIAASCAAFYQAAMFELELPIEGNEAKRQTYLEVFNTLAARGRTPQELDTFYQTAVVQRFSEVATLIQLDRANVEPKVMDNLPKCDAHLIEMKQAAGLE